MLRLNISECKVMMKSYLSENCPHLFLRNKQTAAIPSLTVEPLALNITLCQVMVSLSQKQGLEREVDGDWLTPLRTFVQDTLGSGVKLSYRQLHMLLGTVWKMVLTQRSKSKHLLCIFRKFFYYLKTDTVTMYLMWFRTHS